MPVSFLEPFRSTSLTFSPMDHTKLLALELETLRALHRQTAEKLKVALLDGAPWEAVREVRHDLTELEIALHEKIRETGKHPSGNANRSTT
ncbi:hypothetical protein [Flaviaesturariibacter amylovorans]|uniref:Uncharacterized protein n=1 Tax=Flaviaesturariibacter amylovorans TaxID=1084520 RepID=A0ABP8HR92_9BACT